MGIGVPREEQDEREREGGGRGCWAGEAGDDEFGGVIFGVEAGVLLRPQVEFTKLSKVLLLRKPSFSRCKVTNSRSRWFLL